MEKTHPILPNRKNPLWILKKELQEVIDTVRSAKNNLGKISLHMETEFPDTGSLDEALEALDDAIDIIEDTLDDIE